MKEPSFSKWLPWLDREQHACVGYPGVYAIAHSRRKLTGSEFSWHPEIIYIGMTNSVGGLRARLRQFDNTIIGKSGHGGADRVRYKHRHYGRLCQRLFVAIAPIKCDVTSASPRDLRCMGEVARLEYSSLAHFAELFKKLPEFNDRKNAPKFSLTIGRKVRTSGAA